MKRARISVVGDNNGATAAAVEDNREIELGCMNPLMVPSILELVLLSLPLQSLKDCKAVCSLWHQEVTRVMKRLKTIKMIKDDYLEVDKVLGGSKYSSNILSQLHCKECCTSNDRFEKLLIFKGMFLNQLTLERCHLNVNSFMYMVLTDGFPHLSILTLRQNEYVDVLKGRKTVFIPQDGDEELKFKCLRILEIDERGTETQTSLHAIAEMCPSLQRLTHTNCPIPTRIRNSSVNLSCLNFLQLAPIDGRKMEFQYFDTLVDLKLKRLKTLFLYGMTPGGKKRTSSLHKFLKSVSSSILSLHLGQKILYNPEYQSSSPSPFPISMNKLKRISIGPGFIHSLKFLDKLPCVTSFTCTRQDSKDWDTIISKGVPKSTTVVGSLDLGTITAGPLLKIAGAFPSLCRLELNVSRIQNHDELFRTICGGFPQLQILNIYDVSNQNILTDTGVTGIASSEFEALTNSTGTKSKPKREFSYIGDLKCLIDLRLQYICGNLTDLSVTYGIQDLPSIFALDLSKSLVSDSGLTVLCSSTRNLSVLYLRDCKNITAEAIKQFIAKRPNVQLRL